jgi:hypothetical protein
MTISVEPSEEILLLSDYGDIIRKTGNKKTLRTITSNGAESHFPVNGKRFLFLNNKKFKLYLTKTGISIINDNE